MSQPEKQKWKIRLYIAGDGPNSRRAMANLAEIRLAGGLDDCELEIVDIFEDPQRAFRDGILVTPTLVKLCPEPVWKIIGDLSERSKVMQALGLSGEI